MLIQLIGKVIWNSLFSYHISLIDETILSKLYNVIVSLAWMWMMVEFFHIYSWKNKFEENSKS